MLVAGRIADARPRAAPQPASRAVLGLATGSTPIGVYRELIRMHREEGLSFAHVVTFNLDEYYPMDPDSIHSYHRFMWENLFAQVDITPRERAHPARRRAARAGGRGVPRATRRRSARAGGIDLQILGIGRPDTSASTSRARGCESRTRLVTLDPVTRKDAAADFFGEENVPREAVTMGVATILEAREIAILATGEHKAHIVRRAVEGEVDHEVAATFLQQHPNTTFYLDRRRGRPSSPGSPRPGCWARWSGRTPLDGERRHLALARRPGRRSSSSPSATTPSTGSRRWWRAHGSPGALNGVVFNALGAKIRGRSKLPRRQADHLLLAAPDDDVISMGGILRKLVENENEITVAYMTSGNIAVFDHDVRRYVDFLERLAGERGIAERRRDAAGRAGARTSSPRKRPGDVDIAEVRDIKRMIRESEAVTGLETLGLEEGAARFLNLPFYQTGKVRKDPIGPADVAIVRELLEERAARPRLRRGRSLRSARHAPDVQGGDRPRAGGDVAAGEPLPEVWLYRGAWQEWPVTEATWLVPLSQEELRLKIQAIFKHQSQKDRRRSRGPTSASSGSGWRRGTRGRRRSSTGSGWRSTSRMEAYVVDAEATLRYLLDRHHHRRHPAALGHVHDLALRGARQDRDTVVARREAHHVIEGLRLQRAVRHERRHLDHRDLRQPLDHPQLLVRQRGVERRSPLPVADRLPQQHARRRRSRVTA